MGLCSVITLPAGKLQRRTARTASESSRGQPEEDSACAEVTCPLASTVNSTVTVPVWFFRLASAGYCGLGMRPLDILLEDESLDVRLPEVGWVVCFGRDASDPLDEEGLTIAVVGEGLGISGIVGSGPRLGDSGISGSAVSFSAVSGEDVSRCSEVTVSVSVVTPSKTSSCAIRGCVVVSVNGLGNQTSNASPTLANPTTLNQRASVPMLRLCRKAFIPCG